MKFPSKILLLGEYGLVIGGVGLAIPYSKYTGELTFEKAKTEEAQISNHSLQQFYKYLKNNSLDFLHLESIKEGLDKGLWYDSNIPGGYGLGSSGSMVAAMYSKYRTANENDSSIIKQHLAQMESFFHGFSSGVDPIVSFLQKPILIKNQSSVEILHDWNMKKLGLHIFLVNTGLKSKTISLVDWFKTRLIREDFKQSTQKNFLNINQQITSKVASGLSIEMDELLTVSRYQLDYLSPMVPDLFRQHFFAGLKNGDFAFKLCGSGGGGFMLCFARNLEQAKKYFTESDLNYEEVL